MGIWNWFQHIFNRKQNQEVIDPDCKPVAIYPDWKPVTLPLRDEEMKFDGLVVVHFWATWNGHDRKMDELLRRLERVKKNSRVFFRSLCTDEKTNWPMCEEFKIVSLPSLVAFNKGKSIAILVGVRSIQELQRHIDGWSSHQQQESPVK